MDLLGILSLSFSRKRERVINCQRVRAHHLSFCPFSLLPSICDTSRLPLQEHILHLDHGKKHPKARHIWCVRVTIAVKGHGKLGNKCNRNDQKKTGSFDAQKISGKPSNHRSNANLLTKVTMVTLGTSVVVTARRINHHH